MGMDLTAFDAVLKDDYRPKIVSLINNKSRLLKEIFGNIGDGERDSAGRQVLYPLQVGRNQGVGSVAESGTLPSAGNAETTTVKVPFRYSYFRISLTAQVIKASKTDKGSFKRAMKMEMSQGVDNMARLRNRQLFGFGVGILARVNGTVGSGETVVPLKAPLGVSGLTGGARYILKNSYIAAVRNATPTSATDTDIVSGVVKKVSSIASDKTSITLTATVGTALADNDMIVLAPGGADSTTESSVNKEPMGLLGIVDDGTYITTLFNVSRTTYPEYKANVISLNGNLNVNVLQRGYDLADEVGGGEISHLIAHHSVRREYLNQLQLTKRYVNEMALSPDGGFKGGAIMTDIEFNEKPMIAERMCPYGTIFGVDKSEGARFVNQEGEWADDDGTILLRTSNKDIYEGRFRVFDNFHNDRPDRCFRIDGVAATVDVVTVE